MATTSTSHRLKATAYHEAGHAVVAIHFHRDVVLVSIDSDENSRGRIRLTEPPIVDPNNRDNLQNVEREIMILLAGGLAEKRHRNRMRSPGASNDRRLAWELARKVFGTEKVMRAFLKYLSVRTETILDFWWDAVQDVVEELLTMGQLPGAQVRTMMRASIRQSHRRDTKNPVPPQHSIKG